MESSESEIERESWYIAEREVKAAGPFSTLCTAPIRTVLASPGILHTTSEALLKKFAVDSLIFTLKVSPSLKASLYHAAVEMRKEELDFAGPLTLRKLMECMSAYELCVVISLSYFSTLLSRKCDQAEMERIHERAGILMRIGGKVGGLIDGLGHTNGMFLDGIRLFSLAVFLKKDLEGFKKYRRWIDSNNVLFDLAYEKRLWGCTHLQLASVIVSALGYGIVPRIAFGLDIDARVFNPYRPAIEECFSEIQAWRMGIILSEALYLRKDLEESMAADFETKLDKSALAAMKAESEAILEEKLSFNWLKKGVADLSPEICSQLGIEPKTEREE